jgi:transposase
MLRVLKGRTGYVWWQRGQTPRGLCDVGYQSAWIIGAACPAHDAGIALFITRLDTAAMNLFLAELGQTVAPEAHGILLMDKAGWHTASGHFVPDNLSLVFLPPYSPELKPIERLWLHLRDNRLLHCVFQTTGEIVVLMKAKPPTLIACRTGTHRSGFRNVRFPTKRLPKSVNRQTMTLLDPSIWECHADDCLNSLRLAAPGREARCSAQTALRSYSPVDRRRNVYSSRISVCHQSC